MSNNPFATREAKAEKLEDDAEKARLNADKASASGDYKTAAQQADVARRANSASSQLKAQEADAYNNS